MTEGIEGVGQIARDGAKLCRVRYQLQRHTGADETRFTLTDGLIEIVDDETDDHFFDLQPGQELTLSLAQPLADGRDTLTLIIEPYAGHRPDERYQVSIKEESES